MNHLATAPEVEGVTRQYFDWGRPAHSKPVTYDRDIAVRLWAVSEQITTPGGEIAQHIQEVVR